MPQNGEINTKFDVYQSVCCLQEIIIREGARFPTCPNHPHSTTIWTPLQTDVIDTKTVEKKKASDPAA
jgi:hypothetical protein